MLRFQLLRGVDPTGVSGIGLVAEGVEFTNGKVAITWFGKFPTITVHDSIASVEAIHCHAGMSVIVWLDNQQEALDYQPLMTQALEPEDTTGYSLVGNQGLDTRDAEIEVLRARVSELEIKLAVANEKLGLAVEVYKALDVISNKFNNRWYPLVELLDKPFG